VRRSPGQTSSRPSCRTTPIRAAATSSRTAQRKPPSAEVNRIAYPWLIPRFIDPDAEYVIAVADRAGGYSFNATSAAFGHREQLDGSGWCTFETVLDAYRLGDDPALAEPARIMHARDVGTHPFGAAVRAIGDAGVAVEPDDQQRLRRGRFVYDALYAHCQQTIGETRS